MTDLLSMFLTTLYEEVRMNTKQLFQHLDRDFILPECDDNWSEINFNEFYTNNFKEKFMGLVLDNANHIERVYTAVFASEKVIKHLINNNVTDSLLFTHHPMAWDITKRPIFAEISQEHLQALRDRRISLYSLHTPLDRNSDFSTSVNLTRAFGANILEGFGDYHGYQIAVIAQVKEKNMEELKLHYEEAVGHSVKLYPYGKSSIENGLVAFCAGGGNEPAFYNFLISKGITTYITGITAINNDYQPSVDAHQNAKKHKINVIGGTHYSTEKFACIKIKEYFDKFGLFCEFIEDEPCFEDM